MTAPQIIQKIESAGVLALKGDSIPYDLPKETRTRVDSLRVRLEEALRFLPTRERPEDCYVHGQSGKMVNVLARLHTFDQLQQAHSRAPGRRHLIAYATAGRR